MIWKFEGIWNDRMRDLWGLFSYFRTATMFAKIAYRKHRLDYVVIYGISAEYYGANLSSEEGSTWTTEY